MVSAGRQFLLLLRKNAILQRRKPKTTLVQLLLPALFAALLLAIRQRVEPTAYTEPRVWDAFNVEESFPGPQFSTEEIMRIRLAYAPNIAVTQRIMEQVQARIGFNTTGNGFDTANEMATFLNDEVQNPLFWGGIVFTSDFIHNDTMPTKVRYSLRPRSEFLVNSITDNNIAIHDWFTSLMFPLFQFPGPRDEYSQYGGYPEYNQQGFLALQRALDLSIITEVNTSADVEMLNVELQRFPYPPYLDDPIYFVLQRFLPFLIVLGFLATVPMVSKDVALEKERRLTEYMKIMGLSSWIHWAAWFIKAFLFMVITCLIVTILLTIDTGKTAVIRNSDPSIIFVFFLLYSISTICYAFAISVLFNSANSASAASGIVFFLTYVPYLVLVRNLENIATSTITLASLLNNCAMAFGCVQISIYEGAELGVKWSNFYKPVSVDETYTMGHVFLMLIVDSVLYMLFVWYVDNVRPGQYGVARPWYFCCTSAYWCGRSERAAPENEEAEVGGDQGPSPQNPDLFERNPAVLTPGIRLRGLRKVDSIGESSQAGSSFETVSDQLKAGIQIRNIRKEFKKGKSVKVAVAGTNLDIFEGQITALLGHNGAGKTTTMSMLTGFIRPTSGTAYLGGYNVRSEMDKIRANLGLCPQHDILFDSLTVREHLDFFAQLKGVARHSVTSEVTSMIERLGLGEKTNVLSHGLSGGMKRKLSMGIALIGGSKVVVLDEPTSGMDPEARRQTWDILQRERVGRTMLLSTHFMDEADQLGDRIAIMADGVVQCCGSSLFLKNRYGVGYHLVMVKEDGCDVDYVTKLVKDLVPDARLESNISGELSYTLPHDSSSNFEQLFTRLETDRINLGITSFGASVTTMEEVFLKVGADAGHTSTQSDDVNDVKSPKNRATSGVTNFSYVGDTPDQNSTPTDVNVDGSARNAPAVSTEPLTIEKYSGMFLLLQQFRGMFVKRMIHTWRNRLVFVCQLIVPAVFTLFAILISKQSDSSDAIPEPLPLTLTKFTEAGFHQRVAYVTNTTSQNDVIINDLTNSFMSAVVSTVGASQVTFEHVNTEEGYTDENADIITYLGDVGVYSMDKYSRNYMVAASIASSYDSSSSNDSSMINITGIFNNKGYHIVAITLGYVGGMMLKYYLGDSYTLEATNHPLPKPESAIMEESLQEASDTGLAITLNLMWGMSFLAATFVVFLVRERAIKSKHIQFVSGVHACTFWMSTFAWDFLNFLIPGLLIIILLVAFQVEGFAEGPNIGAVLMLILAYGLAVLPYVYLFNYLFSVPSTGYIVTSVIGFFSGLTFLVAVNILKIPELGLVSTGDSLEWLGFVILPHFALGQGFLHVYTNYFNKRSCVSGEYDLESMCAFMASNPNSTDTHPCCPDMCGDYCASYTDNYLSWDYPGIGRPLIFLPIQAFIFFLLIFILESGFFKAVLQLVENARFHDGREEMIGSRTDTAELPLSVVGATAAAIVEEDADVNTERQRITTTPVFKLQETCSLVLIELRKWYNGLLAVDRLSVGIEQGQCFGLLGVNGAGKTTTFKMMTGDINMSAGDAVLDGYSVKREIKEVQKRLGYCPQFDALIGQMTVYETLVMYARLRGVVEHQIPEVVEHTITAVLLNQYTDKQAATLSGGNKRKLSTAIAIIGDPPVVFLDEPTTGMDPVARRALWDTLTQIRTSGRTLVLTSHSMEECEALCTQIAIMVNGQFKCLGSPQYLKHKFGDGYTLLARVAASDQVNMAANAARLRTFVEQNFPQSQLKDSHQGYVHYQVSARNTSWAKVFGTMESAKQEYNIEDYSVSQTTLEQVFINFARAQRPPREKESKCTCRRGLCCR